MDLAKFAQMPAESGGAFLKFTPNDNVKIVRFVYTTAVGVDEDLGISCRQKLYDTATKKVIWDTPEGKWTMSLKVAVYKSKTEFDMMTWDRSAAFGRDILLPLFESAGGRICDQVYKVTCAKAGTLDATFSFFPIKDSESYAMPNIAGESEAADEEPAEEAPPVVQKTAPAKAATVQKTAVTPAAKATATATPAPTTTTKKKNFWEE